VTLHIRPERAGPNAKPSMWAMDTMAEIAPKFALPNRSAVTVGLAILPIPADPPWRHTNRQSMIVAVPAKARLTLASDRPIKEHMEIRSMDRRRSTDKRTHGN